MKKQYITDETRSFGTRTWERIESIGDGYSPRTGHTVVANKDSLYVFGGTDKRRRQQDLFQYNIETSTWCRVHTNGILPPRRSGAHGIVYDSKFYIFGGYDGRDGNYYNDLYYFDFETRKWNELLPNHYTMNVQSIYPSTSTSTAISTMALPSSTSTVVNNAGISGSAVLPNTTGLTHTTGLSSSIPVQNCVYPEPRTDHIMVLYNAHIYIFGGYDGRCKYDSMFSYSLLEHRWKKINPTSVVNPSRRFGHAGAVHEPTGRLFIFGGWDGKDTLNDLYAYSFRQNQWESISTTGEIPPHRYRHTIVIHENNLFLFGGVNKAHSRFNDLYRLNLKTFVWSEVYAIGHIPSSRTFHRAVMSGSKMYLLGGYDGTDRLHDLYSILVGPLVPNTLLQITAQYTRENVNQVLKYNYFDGVPEDLIGNALWGRDAKNHLRGRCLICREGLCAFYELSRLKKPHVHAKHALKQPQTPSSVDFTPIPCICGHSNIEHEYINERMLHRPDYILERPLHRPAKRLLMTPLMSRFPFDTILPSAS